MGKEVFDILTAEQAFEISETRKSDELFDTMRIIKIAAMNGLTHCSISNEDLRFNHISVESLALMLESLGYDVVKKGEEMLPLIVKWSQSVFK